jgi:hypothetical protein
MSGIKDLFLKYQEGNIDPLDAYIQAKQEDDEHQQYIEELKKAATEEAKRYGEKAFEKGDYYVEVRTGRKMFNFKSCQSWKSKQEELKEVEERLKLSWESLNKNMHTVSDDGEVVEVPEVTFTSDYITFKKLNK